MPAQTDTSFEISINGKPRRIAPGTTIAALIEELKLPWKFVAVESNQSLIPRARHAEHVIQQGEVLEIVTLVGGG
jgi:thiamine biosynthesis protein ThiS